MDRQTERAVAGPSLLRQGLPQGKVPFQLQKVCSKTEQSPSTLTVPALSLEARLSLQRGFR